MILTIDGYAFQIDSKTDLQNQLSFNEIGFHTTIKY